MAFEIKKNEHIDECYYYTTHKSGLKVYIIPKKMSTSYAIFATKFGSIDNRFVSNGKEVVLPDGIAHFLEHKMFENEDGSDTFERYAKTGASANAYTTFDRTCYLFSATDKFYESLEILLDFVTSPYFTEETVSKEMGIIGQEIRMYDDNPGWQLYFGMLTGLYHDNTVRIDTAGDTETIAKITPEILFEAYNAFYNLENMVLCICGDVDEKQVESVCDKVLKYVKALEVKRIYPEEKKGRFKEFISKKLEVSMPMFSVGIKDNECPLSGVLLARKQAEYDILLELMFGKSSEFYTRMYQSGLIDSSFGFGYEAGETYGHCELSGSSMKPLEVYEAIKEEIKKYKEKGVDKGAFERIKRANYASTLRVFNSTEDVANEFLVHAFSEFDMLEYPEVISQVTFEQVCSRLDRCFEEDDFVLSCVYPLDK